MKLMLPSLCTALIIFVASCDDLRTYTVYDDVEQATADGAFSRGWLPAWVSDSAKNIHESHDLDTSEQAISFEVVSPSRFSWPSTCQISTSVAPPRLKTKLFPGSIDRRDGIRNCGGLFAVIDDDGFVHLWGRQNRH